MITILIAIAGAYIAAFSTVAFKSRSALEGSTMPLVGLLFALQIFASAIVGVMYINSAMLKAQITDQQILSIIDKTAREIIIPALKIGVFLLFLMAATLFIQWLAYQLHSGKDK